jgi:hypothetical protein
MGLHVGDELRRIDRLRPVGDEGAVPVDRALEQICRQVRDVGGVKVITGEGVEVGALGDAEGDVDAGALLRQEGVPGPWTTGSWSDVGLYTPATFTIALSSFELDVMSRPATIRVMSWDRAFWPKNIMSRMSRPAPMRVCLGTESTRPSMSLPA